MPLPLDSEREIAARLVVLTLIADGELASREVEALERHHIAELLGVPGDVLVGAVAAHCQGLLARDGSPLRVLDLEQTERLLDSVRDPALRITTCRAMLVLSKADGRITLPEQTLLRHALTRWRLTLEDVS